MLPRGKSLSERVPPVKESIKSGLADQDRDYPKLWAHCLQYQHGAPA